MHKTYKVTAILLLLAVGLSLPVFAYAKDTDSNATAVSAELSYGYDNSAKGGRKLPVHLELTNDSAEDFRGSVSLFAEESDGDIYEYEYALELISGENKSADYCIPVGINSQKIFVRIKDSSGATVYEKETDLNINRANAQLFIGVLSDTPERLEWLNNVSVNYGLLKSKTFELTAEKFPSDMDSLDLFDMIVITNYRIRNLSAEQSRALMDWVRSGGVMVLGTGERADDTLGRYAPELLDDMYDDPEMMEVDLGLDMEASSPDELVEELFVVDAKLRGGNTIVQGDFFNLVTGVNKENGLIVVTAYDLADVSDFAGLHSTFADKLISRILGDTRMNEVAREIYSSSSDKFSYVKKLINSSDSDRVPPVTMYLIAVLAYIVLVGPALFFFLKQRDMNMYYRIAVVIVSVVFALIVYFMGSGTRYKGAFYNYATITSSDEESITETTFLNLRSPYRDTYSVGIAPSYTVTPVTDGLVSSESSDISKSDVGISYASGTTKIKIIKPEAFSSKYFELEKTYDNEEGDGFNGYINLVGKEVSGEISNDYGFDVSDAAVLFYGKMILIGDIRAGETVDITGKDVHNIPLNQSEAVSAIICGLDRFDEDRQTDIDYIKASEKTNIMSFFRDYYMNGYSTDARIVAFSKVPAVNKMVSDEITGSGITMLSAVLPVESRDDDYRLYRSVLIKDPITIQGTYNIKDNTMYASEPLVLEYPLGSDLEISQVIIESAEDKYEIFDGSMGLYNYTTGNYDPVGDRTELDIEELEQYLSPSDTITIKYSYQGEKSSEYVSLPMICVMGDDE